MKDWKNAHRERGITMDKLKVSMVSFANAALNIKWAQKQFRQSEEELSRLGHGSSLFSLFTFPEMILTMKQTDKAIRALLENDTDFLIVHTPVVPAVNQVMRAVEAVGKPVMVWANPEPPKEEWCSACSDALGICAITQCSNILARMGYKFGWGYGTPQDKDVQEKFLVLCRIMRTLKYLHGSRIGVIGNRPAGFYGSSFDEIKLRRLLGIDTIYVDLLELHMEMENLKASKVKTLENKYRDKFTLRKGNTDQNLERSASIQLALENLVQKYELSGIAIKCLPDFAQYYNTAPCFNVSQLTNQGIMVSCEADVNGLVTMLFQYLLSGKPPFLADFVEMDEENNTGFMWHCGQAPLCLAANQEEVVLSNNYAQKTSIVVDFRLRAVQKATLARLGIMNDDYRMLICPGETLLTSRKTGGTGVDFKPQKGNIRNLFDEIVEKHYEHHYSISFVDTEQELKGLCQWLDVKVDVV